MKPYATLSTSMSSTGAVERKRGAAGVARRCGSARSEERAAGRARRRAARAAVRCSMVSHEEDSAEARFENKMWRFQTWCDVVPNETPPVENGQGTATRAVRAAAGGAGNRPNTTQARSPHALSACRSWCSLGRGVPPGSIAHFPSTKRRRDAPAISAPPRRRPPRARRPRARGANLRAAQFRRTVSTCSELRPRSNVPMEMLACGHAGDHGQMTKGARVDAPPLVREPSLTLATMSTLDELLLAVLVIRRLSAPCKCAERSIQCVCHSAASDLPITSSSAPSRLRGMMPVRSADRSLGRHPHDVVERRKRERAQAMSCALLIICVTNDETVSRSNGNHNKT